MSDGEWGKKVPGCKYYVHADREKMKCFPESQHCKSEYDLEELDFYGECYCDFFRHS